MMRIGHGFDTHRFSAGDHIVVGGVTISFSMGVDAHSDGDVVIHALCDAILGAACLGDIGKHFPDSMSDFSGMDSRLFLRHIYELISELGFRVGNVDCTIVCERPKMAPYIDMMKQNLSADLELSTDHVNVKATTTETLGFTGREEGIAAFAVVLLKSADA